MLLHVVEAALPVQRQQHFSARFQRGRHEMHGLGSPPGHPQHRHISDEAAIVRLRTRDVSAASPARPGPARLGPRPYLPAALGKEDGVLQHHLEPVHRLPAALGPQLRRPARHHPGGELRQRRRRREGPPGPAPRPCPGPTLPAGPSCPAGTGTPWPPFGTSQPGLAARAAAEGQGAGPAVAAASGRGLHGDARARSRRRRALPGPVRVSGPRCPARRRPERTAHSYGSSRLLPRAPRG